MNIKVLGPGCANCKTLEARTIEALAELHMTATVEKIVEYADIASYGLMRTPGLVLDGTIVVQGHVPTVEKIKEILLTSKESSHGID